MGILNVMCKCGSKNLDIDTAKKPGVLFIACRSCDEKWAEKDKNPTVVEVKEFTKNLFDFLMEENTDARLED